MSRTSIPKLARAASHSLRQRTLTSAPRLLTLRQTSQQAPRILSIPRIRAFSTTSIAPKGLSPESENPQPTATEPTSGAPKAANISDEQYEELSNEYIDLIVEKLEQLQEEKENVDVEYSSGVLTLKFPPAGTYVINKQPPNKQIWLSSPISGPKRYDYAIWSEGQDSKEGTGAGSWVYLRDSSTLADLLETELGIDLGEDL